jgi:hypothetical protein
MRTCGVLSSVLTLTTASVVYVRFGLIEALQLID